MEFVAPKWLIRLWISAWRGWRCQFAANPTSGPPTEPHGQTHGAFGSCRFGGENSAPDRSTRSPTNGTHRRRSHGPWGKPKICQSARSKATGGDVNQGVNSFRIASSPYEGTCAESVKNRVDCDSSEQPIGSYTVQGAQQQRVGTGKKPTKCGLTRWCRSYALWKIKAMIFIFFGFMECCGQPSAEARTFLSFPGDLGLSLICTRLQIIVR